MTTNTENIKQNSYIHYKSENDFDVYIIYQYNIKYNSQFGYDNHYYCGRGSCVGNPFTMYNESERDEVCNKYKIWFNEQINNNNKDVLKYFDMMFEDLLNYKEVYLYCYCIPKKCHTDTIMLYLFERLDNHFRDIEV